ncbi:glucosaminidase domain-containing protein, partial [bacterium]|nr:glucosaminidase domain-containing protein [bacterium]
MNRRTFLNSLTGIAALSALPMARGEAAKGGSPLELFFDGSQIEALREKWRLPLFQSYMCEMLETDLAADKNFLLKELDLNNHIRHIARANQIVTREAFVWLMTGDRERLNLAKLALKKILAYPVWDYFLEAGTDVIGLQRAPETTIAVSLAYDWLYDQLDEKTLQLIRVQLGPKGCEPCYRTLWGLRYPDQVKGWSYAPAANLEPRDFRRWPYFISQTNLKAIPLSGLAVGAAVLRKQHEKAEEWIEMAQYSYETLAKLYVVYGKRFGIRADMAWAQMIHETGYGQYGGDVAPE